MQVVLIYDKPFWEHKGDMFGLLNNSNPPFSSNVNDYVENRGRFYMFWNCIETSGRPMLIALMAGNAAEAVEFTSDEAIISEATANLTKIFAPTPVPKPSEFMVSRWRSDPFARGSYSYVGPTAQADDYESMARPVGPVHFAGEATCDTHPATVHGAYISGLRAAAGIVESLIGPVPVPHPLVPSRVRQPDSNTVTPLKRSAAEAAASAAARSGVGLDGAMEALSTGPNSANRHTERTLELTIANAIESRLGPRPAKPPRTTANPFLFYTRDHWSRVKNVVILAGGKAGRTEVRNALGKAWRDASDDVKAPYLAEADALRERIRIQDEIWKQALATWTKKAEEIRLAMSQGEDSNRDVVMAGVQPPPVGELAPGRPDSRPLDEKDLGVFGQSTIPRPPLSSEALHENESNWAMPVHEGLGAFRENQSPMYKN